MDPYALTSIGYDGWKHVFEPVGLMTPHHHHNDDGTSDESRLASTADVPVWAWVAGSTLCFPHDADYTTAATKARGEHAARVVAVLAADEEKREAFIALALLTNGPALHDWLTRVVE